MKIGGTIKVGNCPSFSKRSLVEPIKLFDHSKKLYGIALNSPFGRIVAHLGETELFIFLPGSEGKAVALTEDEHKLFLETMENSNLPEAIKKEIRERYPLGKPVIELLGYLPSEKPYGIAINLHKDRKRIVAHLDKDKLFVLSPRGLGYEYEDAKKLTADEHKEFLKIINESNLDEKIKQKINERYPLRKNVRS